MKNNIDDELDHILYGEYVNDFDQFFIQMSWLDFSDNMSITSFSRLFDRPNSSTIHALKDVNHQLKLLDLVVSSGLDFNSKQKGGSFMYGHQVMRSGSYQTIKYTLDNGFKFNQYTDNPVWHSLELLHMNYLSNNPDRPVLLDIIKGQLGKGVDLSKSDPTDFFMKLNGRYRAEGWKDLIALYRNDPYIRSYFNDHTNLMIKKEFFNLVPKEAVDIFIF